MRLGPIVLVLVVVGLVCVGCVSGRDGRTVEREVRAVLEKQVAEWNAGNLAGFMETYAKGERTRFASGGDVTFGWETVFERYRKRYGGSKETMGKLRFSDVDVRVLGAESALAFGRWHLVRSGKEDSGLFTLVLRRMGEGWRIVHDHTSVKGP